MVLREINFNHIKKLGYFGLAIRQNNKIIEYGFMGDVLRRIPHLAEHKVLSQNPYFDEWIIEID